MTNEKNTLAPATLLVSTIDCPCTTFEQDEDCPVGYPSLLCHACDGKGIAPIDKVVALAAEMMKVAEQVEELEDPFAAWESIELLTRQSAQSHVAKVLEWEDINWDIGASSNVPFAWDALSSMNVHRYRVRLIGNSYALSINGVSKGCYPTAVAAKAAAQADHDQRKTPSPSQKEDGQ